LPDARQTLSDPEERKADVMPNIVWRRHLYINYISVVPSVQNLPLARKDDVVDEHSGFWETVSMAAVDPNARAASSVYPYSGVSPSSGSYSSQSYYVLKNLEAGAVYDVLVKAKNSYGWSDWSDVFTFFKKGVGKSTMNQSATFVFQIDFV
jgi:hypothetical protein